MSDKQKPIEPESQGDLHQRSLELSPAATGVIPFVEEEVSNFLKEVSSYRSGDREEIQFMPFRLRQGVYGQRQADAQMLRVKIPGGMLTPAAIEALGEVVDKYAPLKKGHLTTRENMQIHHLSLENAGTAMVILGRSGLSSREACGNTVRNVVAPPTVGVCHDELFDVMPYLAAYVRFAARHPLTQNFPRKFKTSFSGCVDHDNIISPLHDLAFIAQLRDDNGIEQRGFKVLVGGGTSIMPRIGKVLYEFIPVEDYLRVSEAVWMVFNKAETLRKNRMMARIKVLIDRIGIEAFKEMVEDQLNHTGPIDPFPLMKIDDFYKETPPDISSNGVDATSLPEEFLYWRKTNVFSQKQDGYCIAYVTVPQGDIYFNQFSELANLVRECTGGLAFVTQDQNLALRWVPEETLYRVWVTLKDIGLGEPDVSGISDVVSCPGTDSCKLGITSSMGLGRAVRNELLNDSEILNDELVKKIHIKISGCPNGCAQHHVANIGFHGAAMKSPSGQHIPAYELFLGGSYGGKELDDTVYGNRIAGLKIPAKQVPKFITALVGYYYRERLQSEEFNSFIGRVGTEEIGNIAEKYRIIPQLNEDSLDLHMDWEKSVVYKVERGEGECAV